MQQALADLNAKSHVIRQAIAAEEQSDKETGAIYARHVKNYQLWWESDQANLLRDNASHVVIPAFPVIPSKATLYLEYETTRPQKRKREDGSASTGTLGVSGVKQVISALEHWRLNNQHRYPDIPDAQVGLRHDLRIKTFETAAAHKEPIRVKMAHTLKAKGTNADTFTSSDLMRCAGWCLTNFKGPSQIYIGLRDRAMLLTSCSVAFRGDSTRSLLLSDLFMTDVIMNAKGLGETIPALTMLADNAKHNQTGRTDEHGAFRHRHVELCPVGSIALLLFAYYHIRNAPLPDFVPDFSDPQYGDYGKREWYGMHLFHSGSDPMSEMGYDNHRKRVNLIYEKNRINISKVTHAGREFSVKTAREYGATVDGAKALGGWSDSGSFKPCYDRALPVDALLGAAMFDAARPESHFLPREFLEPPPDLVKLLFPWVEEQLAALEVREKETPFSRDIALRQVFTLLIWFRVLLLQDGALLYMKHPQAPLFQYAPFNSPQFRVFAASSVEKIAEVEAQGRLAIKGLPQTLVRGFQGAMSGVSMAQHAARSEQRACMLSMQAQISALTQHVQESGSGVRKRITRARRGPVSVPPPFATASEPSPPAVLISSSVALRLGLTTSSDSNLNDQGPLPSITDSLRLDQSTAAVFEPSQDFIDPLLRGASVNASLGPSSLTDTVPSSVSQLAAWSLLALQYSEARLRRHQWEWIEKTNTFLPHYAFQPVKKITDIWTEWASGLNGFLSVRELTEGWNAKWKRDLRAIKSEWGRRSKVIGLVEKLAAKPNWNLELALQFIRDVYETDSSFPTVRSFCDYLQSSKANNADTVFKKSSTWSSSHV